MNISLVASPAGRHLLGQVYIKVVLDVLYIITMRVRCVNITAVISDRIKAEIRFSCTGEGINHTQAQGATGG